MRKRTRLAWIGVVTALLLVGPAVYASHQFVDVPDDHLFHEDIDWLADNDVTRGCNPPDNTEFCPEESVTRGQMAAFLHRFAQNVPTAGEPGPAGPQGPPGPEGPAGPAGQSLVAQRLTPENPGFGGVRVVAVTGGNTGFDDFDGAGVDLFDAVELEEGMYEIESTVQFFDFTGTTAEGPEYGLARSFLDGEPLGTLWTPDIPDDGNNAAQANGSQVVEVPEGGATLEVKALIRGQAPEDPAGHAGANLVVTRFSD